MTLEWQVCDFVQGTGHIFIAFLKLCVCVHTHMREGEREGGGGLDWVGYRILNVLTKHG